MAGIFGEAHKQKRKALERFRGYSAAKSLEEAEGMKQREQAGFQSKLLLYGLFGQPGTYGSGGVTGAAPGATPEEGAPSAGGIFQEDVKPGGKISWSKTGLHPTGETVPGVLDPEKFGQFVSKTKLFQILSRQVAESEGLNDPQSPFRQTLEQSIKNPIIEQGAETLRESMRYIRNQAAKGGTARRTALKEAQNMLAIERSNRQVSQQLWQANLEFENWIRDYQRQTVNAAMGFTEGLGVDEYVGAMNKASQFMVQTAIPKAEKYKTRAYETAMKSKNRALQKLALGAISLVMSAAFAKTGNVLGGMEFTKGMMQATNYGAGGTGPAQLGVGETPVTGAIPGLGAPLADYQGGTGEVATGGGEGGKRTLLGDVGTLGSGAWSGAKSTVGYLFGKP